MPCRGTYGICDLLGCPVVDFREIKNCEDITSTRSKVERMACRCAHPPPLYNGEGVSGGRPELSARHSGFRRCALVLEVLVTEREHPAEVSASCHRHQGGGRRLLYIHGQSSPKLFKPDARRCALEPA